jgi:uncharacterized membrane protein YqiK
MDGLIGVFVVIGGIMFFIGVMAAIVISFYVKVDQGQALIVNGMGKKATVSFSGGVVYPIVNRKEFMNIRVKRLTVQRSGSDGLICMDNIRANCRVDFFVRVNETEEDVLRVAKSLGCELASDQMAVEELFSSKFSEALKTVGKQFNFVALYQERESFRENIKKVIGTDLNGYILEDVAIDYLEQTPVSELDVDNILDSQGIRKITELTAQQNVITNELRRNEEAEIKKKDVETKEKILSLKRQEAEAEAAMAREIAIIEARETAEATKVEEQEDYKMEHARIEKEKGIGIEEENKQRELQVAGLNRERALATEKEEVKRAEQLAAISREQETALRSIEKDKLVEEEKKQITDIISERIAVEKKVVIEEENIKTIHVTEEAERNKLVKVKMAEASAEETAIQAVREAEVKSKTAEFKAQEQLALAEADRQAAEKEADAKKALAEGIEAEQAAPGLAKARVLIAEAEALEKQGMVQAMVKKEMAEANEKTGLAEAKIEEEKGMAQVRVKEADSAGEEKQRMVDINIRKEEATITQLQGAADAEKIRLIGEAEADSLRARELANAEVILEKEKAHAEGMREKFSAMAEMAEESRAHEEFRMRLDQDLRLGLEQIAMNKEMAKEQAKILSSAFSDAKFDIVGGDGVFFDNFVKALSIGKNIDTVVTKSEVVKTALADHLQGEKNIIEDIKTMVGEGNLSSDTIKNLSISHFLHQWKTADPEQKSQLADLFSALIKPQNNDTQ